MKRILALLLLTLSMVGAATASPPPLKHAYPAKGNLPALRDRMLRGCIPQAGGNDVCPLPAPKVVSRSFLTCAGAPVKKGQKVSLAACGGAIQCNFDLWVGGGSVTVCGNTYDWATITYGTYWDAAPGCYGGVGAIVGFSPYGPGDRRCGPVGGIVIYAAGHFQSVYVYNGTANGGPSFPIHFYGFART